MNKKNKKILIRRKTREVIELRQTERIILFCENCQKEQIFRLKKFAVTKSLGEGDNPENTENTFVIKDE